MSSFPSFQTSPGGRGAIKWNILLKRSMDEGEDIAETGEMNTYNCRVLMRAQSFDGILNFPLIRPRLKGIQ